MSILTELCDLCWQKIDDFNQFCIQIENIHESYNRRFLQHDGVFAIFEDSSQYFAEVEKIHNELASKMFNTQMDDKKYIEPFCIINVDERIGAKAPSVSIQKMDELDVKATDSVLIKQEQTPIDESGIDELSTDILNTESSAMMSDYEDDISFIFDDYDDDDDDEDDIEDEDDNISSDTSYESKEKKRRTFSKTTKSKKSSNEKKQGNRTTKTRKLGKKVSVTTVNVLDEDNKRLLSYVQMKCDVCSDDRVFDSFSEIQNHFLDIHNQNGYIMCCNRKFRRIGRVLQHCTWHENPESFKCDTCNKCFQDNVCLRDHITSMHIPVDERRFQCDQCSRLFAKQHLLNTHLKMKHTIKEERPFVCTESECSQRFVLPAYLRLHVEKVHNKSDSR